MQPKNETLVARKTYERPHVSSTRQFETLALSCGKQGPSGRDPDVCGTGSITRS